MARVISIITHKGGTLKTSLVTNIAGVLSQQKIDNRFLSRRKKVLIVDVDGQGNAGMSFGIKPEKDYEYTIYDVMLEGVEVRKAITNAYKTIDIIGSNTDMISFELDVLAIKKIPNTQYFNLLKNAIDPIREEYDYILIDTPPNLGLIAGNVLTATDDVLIPFHPEPYSMQSLITILKQIKDFKTVLNKNINILGVVGTMVESQTNLHSDILAQCRQLTSQIGVRMFNTVIPKSIRFANSVAYNGLPATLGDKKHKLVQSYFELVEEMNI